MAGKEHRYANSRPIPTHIPLCLGAMYFPQHNQLIRKSENLSFLAVNNRFPSSLSLKDYAKIDVLTSLRGHDQYAMFLVHENKVLVEGQAGEHGKMAKGLFRSIAMEVGRVIRERKDRGEGWVGA